MSDTHVKKDLFEAISKLKAFSERLNAPKVASPFSRTVGFMRHLWERALKGNEGAVKEQEEIIRAVEEVNRERLSIQKMQMGTLDEKKTAEILLSAIDSYNKLSQKLSGTDTRRFLSEKLVSIQALPKIEIPKKSTVTYHYSQGITKELRKGSIHLMEPLTSQLSTQSADMFRMKAISLLEKFGIASNPEARYQVRTSPIEGQIEGDEVCTLTQKLTLFPGQTIVVMGKSALDHKTKLINKIFPETFSISLESTQTAYPHPLQRAGWSLVNELIPEFPQRIDLLSHTAKLFMNKRNVCEGLQPNGDLIGKAKKILRLKKAAFEKNREGLTLLHEELSRLIVAEGDGGDEGAVSAWYAGLKGDPFAYDRIAEANQVCGEHFIAKPFKKLHAAIINGKDTPFGSSDAAVRYAATKTFLDQALKEVVSKYRVLRGASSQIHLDYIAALGEVLGRASHAIILQYLSEDLIFEPPTLSDFERKVQEVVYRHVFDFIEEFNSDVEFGSNRLEEYLKWDIAIFSGEKPLKFAPELATYFAQRHQNLNLRWSE